MRLRISSIVMVAILFVISCAVWFFEHRSKIAENEVFSNMTYLSNSPYISGEVSLRNGQYHWTHISEDEVFVYYYLQYDGRYVHGDFNHDGLKDAAVIMTEMNGGTAEVYTVAFLINDGKKLVHRASGGLGDRVIINSLREKNGKVLIDMFVHQGNDCMTGPTQHVKSVFQYESDGDRVEEKRAPARSFLDPLILMLKDYSLTYVIQRWDDLRPAVQSGDFSLCSK